MFILTLLIANASVLNAKVSLKPVEEVNIVLDVQTKINEDIDSQLKELNNDKKRYASGMKVINQEKNIICDYRNDQSIIKKSLKNPVTIYEEVTRISYEIDSNVLVDEKNVTNRSASSYEEQIKTTSRTYDGVTTTVKSIIGFYLNEDVPVDGTSNLNFYKLASSDITFSASDDAHVSYITAYHHQRGVDYNNNYEIIIDGNSNSSDRSEKNFSTFTNNGGVYWTGTHSDFSGLSVFDSGGAVGTFYEIRFSWPMGGGGQNGFDTLERTNAIGSLPN